MIDAKSANYMRAMQLLAAGEFDAGWPLYESRSALQGFEKPALPFPEWRGEDLTGKRLLVWPEQGLGDKIMFARYLPLIGAEVTVLCEPALERLFRANLGATVIAASGKTEFPDPDAWVRYGSLPYRTGLARIPAAPT
jgi:hypothetical protein